MAGICGRSGRRRRVDGAVGRARGLCGSAGVALPGADGARPLAGGREGLSRARADAGCPSLAGRGIVRRPAQAVELALLLVH